jgi:hypothetical protein
MLALSWAAAGQGTASALVPATGFDADLEEDGDVQLCNPEGVEQELYLRAIVNLNADTSLLPGADPAYVDVTGTGGSCEAQVQRFDNGGDCAPLARWNYRLHPDGLQINVDSDKFPALREGQELATITQEWSTAADWTIRRAPPTGAATRSSRPIRAAAPSASAAARARVRRTPPRSRNTGTASREATAPTPCPTSAGTTPTRTGTACATASDRRPPRARRIRRRLATAGALRRRSPRRER